MASETSGQDQEIHICWHTKKWVSALADGSLHGLARLYMKLHLLHCTQCRKALEALIALRKRLAQLRAESRAERSSSLSPPARATLESALDEIDRRQR